MASNPPPDGTSSTPNPPKRPSDSQPNVLERTGYDPDSKAKSYLNLFRGKLTDEGAQLMMMDIEYKKEAEDCARCEKTRDYLLAYSPIVRFLNEKITGLNGGNLAGKIECQRCITRIEKGPNGENVFMGQAGGFSPGHGILICANKVRDQKHQEDVMAHEMVHAWDHLRWKVDWNDLRHAACTEIRASTLSGECRWTREFFSRNHYRITQQFQNCVRDRAIRSVMARPRCKDDVMAAKVVNEVFESCFNDTRPFDEVYK